MIGDHTSMTNTSGTVINRFQGGTGSILVFGDAWSLYPSRFEHQIVLIKFTSSGHGCWMSWKIHIVASKTKTPPSHQPISFAKCGSRNQPVSQTPRYHYSRHRSSDRRTQWTLDVSRHMSGPRGFLSGFKGKKSDLSELLKLFPCSLRICFFLPEKKTSELCLAFASSWLSTKLWLKGDVYFWSW